MDRWLRKAGKLREAGEWDELLAYCLQWTKEQPGMAKSWHNLGMAYVNLHRPEEAVNAFQRVIEILPDSPKGWLNLGNAYLESGLGADAVKAYRQAVRFCPDDAEALHSLGMAYNWVHPTVVASMVPRAIDDERP